MTCFAVAKQSCSRRTPIPNAKQSRAGAFHCVHTKSQRPTAIAAHRGPSMVCTIRKRIGAGTTAQDDARKFRKKKISTPAPKGRTQSKAPLKVGNRRARWEILINRRTEEHRWSPGALLLHPDKIPAGGIDRHSQLVIVAVVAVNHVPDEFIGRPGSNRRCTESECRVPWPAASRRHVSGQLPAPCLNPL